MIFLFLKRKYLRILVLILMVNCIFASSKKISLSVDSRNFYPFHYLDNGKVKGMHIDIVRQALENLGYKVKIVPLPNKRARLYAAKGSVDGMISLPFQKIYAVDLIFPPKSQFSSESKWRIMQVDTVLVTHKVQKFKFTGNYSEIPQPVRINLGDPVADNLKRYGLEYDDSAIQDESNLYKLVRDQQGSVLTSTVLAENFLEQNIFQSLEIQAVPFSSESYYLAFSKAAKLSETDQLAIWSEIARLRDDYVFMLQVFAQY